MADLHDILIAPVDSEKADRLEESENTYVFKVGLDANKIQIRQAVEQLFGVKVKSVRTAVVRGKVKRRGRHLGKRSDWKKAYVTLAEGYILEL